MKIIDIIVAHDIAESMGVEIRHLARKCIILENKEKTTILKKAILRISEKSDTRINYNRNLQPSKRLPTLNAAAFYQAILDQYYDKDAVQTFPVSEITKTVFFRVFHHGLRNANVGLDQQQSTL